MLSLASRAGFRLEGQCAVQLPWAGPAGERGAAAAGELLVLAREQAAGRWRVTYQEPELLPEVQALFQRVFGHPMSEALWHWKYGQGRGQGALTLRDGRVVAHYGGLTREVRFLGRREWAGQVADVMVEAGDRGVLTRQGAFFRAAASVPETCSGYGSKHLIGFGFPNRRHFTLAERLGLYAEVGRMVEPRWPAAAATNGRWRLADLAELPAGRAARAVERLWAAMARDLQEAIVGVRDYAWLRYRYLQHPEYRYRVFGVRRRWRPGWRGVIVLREHAQRVELMDLVGSLGSLPELVAAARDWAAAAGYPEVFAWITSTHAASLGLDDATVTDPDVVVPTSIRTPGPAPAELNGRWWLMSGDTDFR
ncbi:hypothetical protein TVNIR_1907 [Thioalkalivibrio nitratireducens DSM 14787]|uniref:GNAT family N-acetyltransferase n=1 Tax=Thioalkalivibrio nitratireducens (strain DSM 14787 / UNIQEM 213 / ALEN2) TaxID=1255043 RepID=L0DWZ2_THIND|nr:GNAT family N-acetyltransferase [Thioalkalivibrio nitratireducens]AGA33568.1 hypothetical protein TVNIR_1907 [Thioalkalivibrio nitratireducens DSM 14787]